MAEPDAKQNGAEKVKRGPSDYVVLQQQGETFAVIGSVKAVTGNLAKRAVAAKLDLQEGGEGITLVAVPAKSWKVETFKVERPAPRLVAA